MTDIVFQYSPQGKLYENFAPIKEHYSNIYKTPEFHEFKSGRISVLSVWNKNGSGHHEELYSNRHNTFIWIIGTVFLSNDIKNKLSGYTRQKYQDDYDVLLALYEDNGIEIFKEITGWFNVLTYCENTDKIELVNSKLGMDMIYYYSNQQKTIISNRLSIYYLILPDIRINYGVVLQQSLYNYPFLNKTHISYVYTLPAASHAEIDEGKLKINTYWAVRDEFVSKPFGFSESLELLDNILDSVIKRLIQKNKNLALSLTGGWDGRLILAYVLKYIDASDIFLYSFGVEESSDITIPSEIAKNAGYNYLPIILGEEYLEKEYLKWASETVINSDSLRPIKRAHYLYALDKIANYSNIILSGIGGSNLLKSSAYAPCNVFNRFVMSLIHSNDYVEEIRNQYNYLIETFRNTIPTVSIDEFIESFNTPEIKEMFQIKNKSERFTYYLVSNIERKYFGSELDSYKHLITNFSPFLDYEFIRALIRTSFFGGYSLKNNHFPTFKNSLLYARLISRNNKQLARETTDRGFSMDELLNPLKFGQLAYKYSMKRYLMKRKPFSHYNTDNAVKQFADKYNLNLQEIIGLESKNKEFVSNYISFKWFEKYMLERK